MSGCVSLATAFRRGQPLVRGNAAEGLRGITAEQDRTTETFFGDTGQIESEVPFAVARDLAFWKDRWGGVGESARRGSGDALPARRNRLFDPPSAERVM